MCIGLDLVSNTGRVISQLKIGRPHQHVPPGKQYTKVVPAQHNLSGISGVAELATFGGLNGFMPYADAVVPPVKSRADPKPLADGAKPHAKIGMLKTLTQLGDSHNGDELGRSDSNALGYYDQDDVA